MCFAGVSAPVPIPRDQPIFGQGPAHMIWLGSVHQQTSNHARIPLLNTEQEEVVRQGARDDRAIHGGQQIIPSNDRNKYNQIGQHQGTQGCIATAARDTTGHTVQPKSGVQAACSRTEEIYQIKTASSMHTAWCLLLQRQG